MTGAQSICISDLYQDWRLNPLWKGMKKTRHHHNHFLLNAIQANNVDKVKRDARSFRASHTDGDTPSASLAQSLHGCSWGF